MPADSSYDSKQSNSPGLQSGASARQADAAKFIPFRRADLLEMCLADGRLPRRDHGHFRKFCRLLFASYHYQYLQVRETLKDCFASLNPDADTLPRPEGLNGTRGKSRRGDDSQSDGGQNRLFRIFERVLAAANYRPLSRAELARAFEEESLIQLRTKVDFNDFEQMLCYTRGDSFKETVVRKLFFWKRKRSIAVYERLVLMLKFKDAEYFAAKRPGRRQSKQTAMFTPGKLYLYYYKNVPRHDLEVLFPNLETRMTIKDLLLFIIPAIGAAVWLLIKALPQILIITVAIVFFTMGPEILALLDLEEYQIQSAIPVLIALFTVVATLGGFALRQYSNYRRKQIQFQKNITDTLFFRNLAANEAVLHSLVDQAEEEITKEIMLVYYHLLTSKQKLSPPELDLRIEEWMRERFGIRLDFDIHDPIDRLGAFGAIPELADSATKSQSSPRRPAKLRGTAVLIQSDRAGRLNVPTLKAAAKKIDSIWDALF
ncbi:MAG: TMEM143 family protein [bacterium]|nr:TMEM143 family protein [bacterium]